MNPIIGDGIELILASACRLMLATWLPVERTSDASPSTPTAAITEHVPRSAHSLMDFLRMSLQATATRSIGQQAAYHGAGHLDSARRCHYWRRGPV